MSKKMQVFLTAFVLIMGVLAFYFNQFEPSHIKADMAAAPLIKAEQLTTYADAGKLCKCELYTPSWPPNGFAYRRLQGFYAYTSARHFQTRTATHYWHTLAQEPNEIQLCTIDEKIVVKVSSQDIDLESLPWLFAATGGQRNLAPVPDAWKPMMVDQMKYRVLGLGAKTKVVVSGVAKKAVDGIHFVPLLENNIQADVILSTLAAATN